MAQFPDWNGPYSEAAAWDTCYLGKHLLPGYVTIECEKARDIDVQKSPEVDGAKQKNNGITPAKVKIKLRLRNDATAFPEWCAILKQIDPHRPGAAKEPYQILNPEPNHLGIDQISILEIKSSSPNCKSGKTYDIECQQWFPMPKPAKSKTTAQKKNIVTIPEIEIRPGEHFRPDVQRNTLEPVSVWTPP